MYGQVGYEIGSRNPDRNFGDGIVALIVCRTVEHSLSSRSSLPTELELSDAGDAASEIDDTVTNLITN